MNTDKLKAILNRFGIEISRYRDPVPAGLKLLLDKYDVDLILDVGANSGQSAHYFRTIGYNGKIISFEPIRDLFHQLQKLADTDSNMLVVLFIPYE